MHKILVVIEPLLIDEDYYARVEGRENISNLSKAAGLATVSLFACSYLAYQPTNNIFFSHQTSQQYFQPWLISQTSQTNGVYDCCHETGY